MRLLCKVNCTGSFGAFMVCFFSLKSLSRGKPNGIGLEEYAEYTGIELGLLSTIASTACASDEFELTGV